MSPTKISGNYNKNPPIYPPHQPETAKSESGKDNEVKRAPEVASNSNTRDTNKTANKLVGTGGAAFSNSDTGAFDSEYFGASRSLGHVTSPARMMASYHSGLTSDAKPKDTWNWERVKSRIKQVWANLTDEEVDYYAINHDRFFTAVHNRYGINKEEAASRLADWEKNNPNYAA